MPESKKYDEIRELIEKDVDIEEIEEKFGKEKLDEFGKHFMEELNLVNQLHTILELNGIKYEKGKAIVNGAKVVVSQFYKELQRLDNYIITEFVNQAEYSKEIYPYTVNTIRILTMWDYENSIPFIAIAVHRIGTQRSYPVDNWTQGGMSAHINIETGELGPGVTYPFDGKLRFYSRHPETDSPIQGVRVPNWEKVRETVLKLASNLPFLPYIAWDVVLDENKNIRIIEGNSNTDVNLLQVHKPFLSDARIKKFYSYHGVL